MAFPTANKNDGNTRSVGVKPCQAAWFSMAKGSAPLPGVFTIIMKQTVIPRNTSSDKKRCGWFIVLGYVQINYILGSVLKPAHH